MTDKLTLTKLELLRMARELVINEYIDKRAQDHNAWIAQADVVWRTQGVRLAYPVFPQYPTEVDILTRAQALNTFLSSEDQPVEKPKDVPIEITPVPEEISTPPVVVDVEEEVVVQPLTNYVSMPAIYGDIINKQNQSLPGIVTDTNEQPISALNKLKNSLGLK